MGQTVRGALGVSASIGDDSKEVNLVSADGYDVMEADEQMAEDSMDVEEEPVLEEPYEEEEIDEMLDALVEEDQEQEDLAERRRRRRRSARPVVTPFGRPALPMSGLPPGAPVTQRQLQALEMRVARNGQGIRAVNARVNTVNGRVNGVVAVNRAQNRQIGRVDKIIKIDGAFELIEAYSAGAIDLYQLLKGAVKSGFIVQSKGPLSNPLVIGGIGLVLRNPSLLPGIP